VAPAGIAALNPKSTTPFTTSAPLLAMFERMTFWPVCEEVAWKAVVMACEEGSEKARDQVVRALGPRLVRWMSVV